MILLSPQPDGYPLNTGRRLSSRKEYSSGREGELQSSS